MLLRLPDVAQGRLGLPGIRVARFDQHVGLGPREAFGRRFPPIRLGLVGQRPAAGRIGEQAGDVEAASTMKEAVAAGRHAHKGQVNAEFRFDPRTAPVDRRRHPASYGTKADYREAQVPHGRRFPTMPAWAIREADRRRD
jgi:hypothetical protein